MRKPPTFTVEPDNLYQRKISDSVEMHCDAQEAEGTQKPKIQWQRVSNLIQYFGYHTIIINNVDFD